MKKINLNVAIFIATFLPGSVFAAVPVNDLTATKSVSQIDEQLQELTRLLEARNKMQIRLQNQLDQLSNEMNQINGRIELFNHKIEQVENRQRDLYQLIDEQNKPANNPVASTASNAPEAADEKIAYQRGVDLVFVDKNYEQAIVAFKAFVVEYPKSSYVANAQYWLGQLLNKNKQREEAKVAYLVVTEQFPNSSKRPDALYKVGLIDEYLGDIASAKDFYNKVLKEYPDSSAAGLAGKRLKAL